MALIYSHPPFLSSPNQHKLTLLSLKKKKSRLKQPWIDGAPWELGGQHGWYSASWRMPEVALLQPKLPSQSKRNVVLFFQGDFFSFFLLKNLVDLEFQFLGDLFWLAQLEARFHFLAFCFLYFLLLI